MKRIFAILLIAGSFAACNNKYKNAQTDAVDSVKIMKDSLRLDSFQRAEADKKAEMEAAAARPVVNNYNTTSGSSSTQAAAPQKKGMSSAAKGAIIGGAAGAVGGVLIDKKDGRGAIIGGAAGAGAGYLIGRDKDKKSGRVQ